MRITPEREVKLGASPTFLLPDLDGVVEGVSAGAERTLRLETTYYDTADLRLARWGFSLRHRVGEGWTIKLPTTQNGSLLARDEVTFEGGPRRVPEAAAGLLRAYTRGSELQPVARLSTRRRRVQLLGADGQELAEVVDDEVSILQGRRVAARFREVEVELRPDGDQLLAPLLARLRLAGAGAPDPTPKLVRALGPAALAAPEVSAGELAAEATTAEVIQHAVAAGVELLLRHDPLVRVGGDPEDVHQARVATRRLRSHLRLFRPFLDLEWADSLRAELGWLGDELGAVRDAEVRLDRVRAQIRKLPEADAAPAAGLTERLEAQVNDTRSELLKTMASSRYVGLVERLVAAANELVFREEMADRLADPAARVLPALAIKPWRDLRRAVRAFGPLPADEELHAARILAKRVRYVSEAVAPVVGLPAARFAKLAAALQTELGEHQDSVTLQAWLRTAATSTRRAFAAGELAALERARAERARRRWPEAWARLRRPRARAWMMR